MSAGASRKRRHSGDHSLTQQGKRAKRSCLTLLEPFTFLITSPPIVYASNYTHLTDYLEAAINDELQISATPLVLRPLPLEQLRELALEDEAHFHWEQVRVCVNNANELANNWFKISLVDKILSLQEVDQWKNAAHLEYAKYQHDVWWVRQAAQWFARRRVNSFHIMYDEYLHMGVAALVLECFYRFVWARHTLLAYQALVPRRSSSSQQQSNDMDIAAAAGAATTTTSTSSPTSARATRHIGRISGTNRGHNDDDDDDDGDDDPRDGQEDDEVIHINDLGEGRDDEVDLEDDDDDDEDEDEDDDNDNDNDNDNDDIELASDGEHEQHDTEQRHSGGIGGTSNTDHLMLGDDGTPSQVTEDADIDCDDQNDERCDDMADDGGESSSSNNDTSSGSSGSNAAAQLYRHRHRQQQKQKQQQQQHQHREHSMATSNDSEASSSNTASSSSPSSSGTSSGSGSDTASAPAGVIPQPDTGVPAPIAISSAVIEQVTAAMRKAEDEGYEGDKEVGSGVGGDDEEAEEVETPSGDDDDDDDDDDEDGSDGSDGCYARSGGVPMVVSLFFSHLDIHDALNDIEGAYLALAGETDGEHDPRLASVTWDISGAIHAFAALCNKRNRDERMRLNATVASSHASSSSTSAMALAAVPSIADILQSIQAIYSTVAVPVIRKLGIKVDAASPWVPYNHACVTACAPSLP